MENTRLPDSLLAYLGQVRLDTDARAPWTAAFRERRYSDALSEIETQLEAEPEDLHARLWWVLVQLEQSQVPLSALTTPLLELLPQLKEDQSSWRLSFSVLLSILLKLREKQQGRLGVVVLEHSLDFAELSGALAPQQHLELHHYALAFLDEELGRAKTKRESKDYVTRLEKKISERKAKVPVAASTPKPAAAKTPRARKNTLSSKSLFEEALTDSTSEVEKAVLASLSMDEQSIRSESESKEAVSEEKPRRLPTWLLIASASLFVIVGSYRLIGFLVHRPSAADSGMLLAMNTVPDYIGPATLPDVSLNKRERFDRKMQHIGSNLEQMSERMKSIGAKTAEATPPKSLEELSKDPQVDAAALASQASQALANAPTKSDEELAPLVTPDPQAPVAKLDPRRTPKLDPSGVANVKVEDLGLPSPPRPNDKPKLRVGPDGRLYGPPADLDPAIVPPSAPGVQTALDGSPLRSYEVQDFPQPQLYKTITATNVLSAPSLLAVAVSRLEADTTVHVVSKMGQWLELRSTQGRKGFIFAQDASPAN